MSCNLDKYTNYDVDHIDQVGQKIRVFLKKPPVSCPDGFLSNRNTTIKENADVDHTVLSFSKQMNAPVVLKPRGTPAVVVKTYTDPVNVPTTSESHWFLITLLLAAIGAAIWYFFFREKPKESVGYDPFPGYAAAGGVGASRPQPYTPEPVQRPAPAAPAAPGTSAPVGQPGVVMQSTTKVVHHHHDHGGGAGDLAAGVVIGSMLSGGHSHDREVIREREIIREREAPRRDDSYSSDREEKADDDSFSSDSDDSTSSDSDDSTSSDSDSDDSYSSDSDDSSSSDD